MRSFASASRIELVGPIAFRARRSRYSVDSHHLPERLGLLAIILLGESVVALGTAMEETGLEPRGILSVVIGFLAMAATWRTYFDLTEARIVGRELRHGHLLIDWHLPLYAMPGWR